MPYVWTLVTSVFFEVNPIYVSSASLTIQLALNLLMLNHFIKMLEDQWWTARCYLSAVVFVALASGLVQLTARYLVFLATGNEYYL